MNRRILPIMAFSVLILMISSCCKKRRICDGETLRIAFTGYDRSEIRNVLLKRYVKGDKIKARALDSIQLVNNSPIPVATTKPDTSWLSNYTATAVGNGTNAVRYGYDWILIITSTNTGYKIADIYEGDNRYTTVPCNDGDTKCTNNIKSYSINDFWVESNTLYISKKKP